MSQPYPGYNNFNGPQTAYNNAATNIRSRYFPQRQMHLQRFTTLSEQIPYNAYATPSLRPAGVPHRSREPTHTPYAASLDTITTNEWYNEWQTAQFDPLPSEPRALSLLTEPAKIDLHTHAWKAKRAHLSYFDADNEPEGAILQRLEREEQAKRRAGKEAANNIKVLEAKKVEQEQARRSVRKAAKTMGVVDLTGEHPFANGFAKQQTSSENTENYYPQLHEAFR